MFDVLKQHTSILMRIVRFGIAGAAAVGTNLSVLWILLNSAGFPYLFASGIAFLSGFVTSFLLQKFWTFRDYTIVRIGHQILIYFGIVLINLGLNTVIVYILVEYIQLIPIFAQAIAALVIAFEGFFAYRFLVFRTSNATLSQAEEASS